MTVDRGEIDAQLREIGEGQTWWELREFRELPYVLNEDELIAGLARGKLRTSLLHRLRPVPRPRWLFVATNQRLICLRKHQYSRSQLDIYPGQIQGVRQGSRVRSYQISIRTADRRYRLRIPKDQAFRFGAALAPLIPSTSIQRLPADLEPLSWIPGMAAVASHPMVAGLVEKVSQLSPPDRSDQSHDPRLHSAVQDLQQEVERLQQRVTFLEDLLEDRNEERLLSAAGGENGFGSSEDSLS